MRVVSNKKTAVCFVGSEESRLIFDFSRIPRTLQKHRTVHLQPQLACLAVESDTLFPKKVRLEADSSEWLGADFHSDSASWHKGINGGGYTKWLTYMTVACQHCPCVAPVVLPLTKKHQLEAPARQGSWCGSSSVNRAWKNMANTAYLILHKSFGRLHMALL